MTQTISVNGTTSYNIPRDSCEWTDSAYLGEVGTGRFTIDDAAGTATATGHKAITVVQDAGTPTRLYTGTIGRKSIKRESGDAMHTVSTGRFIEVSTNDLNDRLNRYIITGTDGKRSAETVAARITWLLASDYLTALVTNEGAVTSATTLGMDATDYRGQRPGDVLAACAKKARFNYYVRYHSTSSAGAELVFRDDNASSSDTSTISIAADSTANGTSIFAPQQDWSFDIDPEHVYSHAYASYAKGVVTDSRAATATAFVTRWGSTDDSGIKTSAAASSEATTFLWESRAEEYALTLTLRMRAAYVNLIRAGQRVSATIPGLTQEGYGTATYFRVLRRRVTQPLNTDNDYDVALDLSPQEEAPPAVVIPGSATFVQRAFGRSASGGGYLSLANPVTIGNLLVFAIGARSHTSPSQPSINPAQPNFGTGSWTKLPNVTINAGRTGAQGDGVAIWYKTADSVDATGFIPQAMGNYGIWEIAGADIASATAISAKEQADSTTMDIGTLGVAATTKVAVMIHLWAEQAVAPPFASPPHPTLAAVTPDTGWTTRWYDSSFESYPLLENAPVVAICDATGTGATLNPSLGKSALSNWADATWCGAAVLIPAL